MACVFCQSPNIHLIGDALFDCADCGGMFLDYDAVPRYSPRHCDHKFVENGCQRSWCKYCDVDGVFVFELGGYTTYDNARILSGNTEKKPD